MTYQLCEKLPKAEERNLVDQLRRAATSIALNIAEGSAAEGDKEFKKFIYISRKSQIECIAILKLINKLYNIPTEQETEKAEAIGKMLFGLVKSLNVTQ